MNHRYHCPMPLDAIGALALGQKVEAIKIVRKENSLSLKEAKALVEAYEDNNPDLYPQHLIDESSSSLFWIIVICVFIFGAFMAWLYLLTA